jgi:hypothetical protein
MTHRVARTRGERGERIVEGVGLQTLLESFLTESNKNRVVVDVFLELKRSLEIQNRILLELYEKVRSKTMDTVSYSTEYMDVIGEVYRNIDRCRMSE